MLSPPPPPLGGWLSERERTFVSIFRLLTLRKEEEDEGGGGLIAERLQSDGGRGLFSFDQRGGQDKEGDALK